MKNIFSIIAKTKKSNVKSEFKADFQNNLQKLQVNSVNPNPNLNLNQIATNNKNNNTQFAFTLNNKKFTSYSKLPETEGGTQELHNLAESFKNIHEKYLSIQYNMENPKSVEESTSQNEFMEGILKNRSEQNEFQKFMGKNMNTKERNVVKSISEFSLDNHKVQTVHPFEQNTTDTHLASFISNFEADQYSIRELSASSAGSLMKDHLEAMQKHQELWNEPKHGHRTILLNTFARYYFNQDFVLNSNRDKNQAVHNRELQQAMDGVWAEHKSDFEGIANAHYRWSCLKFNGMLDDGVYKQVDRHQRKLEAMFGRTGIKRKQESFPQITNDIHFGELFTLKGFYNQNYHNDDTTVQNGLDIVSKMCLKQA